MLKKVKLLINQLIERDLYFFSLLFGVLIVLFRNSFFIGFFSDDYTFLKLSYIENINGLINFFIPGKLYFYRPLSTEVFYGFIQIFPNAQVVGHLIVMSTYATALIGLYKVSIILAKNKTFSKFFIFMYAIHFSHVFQLYWLATFQEVIMFCFLVYSTLFFLKQKYIVSIFLFFLALLSKETAIVYPVFLLALLQVKQKFKKTMGWIFVFISLSLATYFAFYLSGIENVEQIDIYRINLSPKLIVNNSVWYVLWALGFPSFLPDYASSFFSLPLPGFWERLSDLTSWIYISSLVGYLSILLFSIFNFLYLKPKRITSFIPSIFFLIFGTLLFLSPTLPIIHRWMVRLTIPLIFITFSQAYLIYFLISKSRISKIIAMVGIIFYIIYNVVGISVHEIASVYSLESEYYHRAQIYFNNLNNLLPKTYTSIYFKDSTEEKNAWGESKKLKTSFAQNAFLYHFMPNRNFIIYYEVDKITVPKDSFIIPANDILKQ
ncbi:hypothetical protein COV58_04775 [Candidatus Roizmanbacteria bacterium CG11_big_fil_rev_8_21_14_0_20_36_8]|uniref:Glycosyltransferase RgtA/B/C/D-like domain-containing protein n=2 Tax=Candidatus Roizmaniibacteriota TaxID=1752723 RepID=A0A2M6IT13_9BACT|nr:MAG: hypothetical protein COV58_04775 [Candidatus Roizmanbacteria bacterium CG11_big_fil_rev_8_21_14_0_20_36_8]PIZ64774.1 MAG: hypothetical protein COY14_03905 [Candidatus Roizmanbacteria bacterium CG_4_10_14_0_2_um_filter_36_9]